MNPFTFELMGRTVTVKFEDQSFFDDVGAIGLWNSKTHEISILDCLTEEAKWHTFYHEFCHAALESLGHDKLSSDEKLVDQMGNLILQMLKSQKPRNQYEAAPARHRDGPE